MTILFSNQKMITLKRVDDFNGNQVRFEEAYKWAVRYLNEYMKTNDVQLAVDNIDAERLEICRTNLLSLLSKKEKQMIEFQTKLDTDTIPILDECLDTLRKVKVITPEYEKGFFNNEGKMIEGIILDHSRSGASEGTDARGYYVLASENVGGIVKNRIIVPKHVSFIKKVAQLYAFAKDEITKFKFVLDADTVEEVRANFDELTLDTSDIDSLSLDRLKELAKKLGITPVFGWNASGYKKAIKEFQKKEAEAEKKRLADAADAKKAQEEAKARQLAAQEEEKRVREAAEAEAKKAQKEEEAKRLAEEERVRQLEEAKRLQEAEDAKRVAEEKAVRDAAAAKKAQEEADAAKRLAAQEEEKKLREAAEAEAKRVAEATKKAQKEEEAKRLAEAEQVRQLEEAKRLQEAEEAKRLAEEKAAAKKAQEEADAAKRLADAQEAARKAQEKEEEERNRRQAKRLAAPKEKEDASSTQETFSDNFDARLKPVLPPDANQVLFGPVKIKDNQLQMLYGYNQEKIVAPWLDLDEKTKPKYGAMQILAYPLMLTKDNFFKLRSDWSPANLGFTKPRGQSLQLTDIDKWNEFFIGPYIKTILDTREIDGKAIDEPKWNVFVNLARRCEMLDEKNQVNYWTSKSGKNPKGKILPPLPPKNSADTEIPGRELVAKLWSIALYALYHSLFGKSANVASTIEAKFEEYMRELTKMLDAEGRSRKILTVETDSIKFRAMNFVETYPIIETALENMELTEEADIDDVYATIFNQTERNEYTKRVDLLSQLVDRLERGNGTFSHTDTEKIDFVTPFQVEWRDTTPGKLMDI